ncbi:MAG: FHA domain-containing protein [Oscillospiraceae bacterium]|nr:FHA domain-containing protein [Oscillospiraceae bacterium]
MAEFFMRMVLIVAVGIVLFFCLSFLFKKSHGKMVLAQLINTVNGDRVDITSWESAIGRAKTCDVVLNYAAVSRFHAVLARRNKGWIIFDTHSKTGIQVNGKHVNKQAYVYDGDIVTVGNVVMCFRSPLFKRGKKPESAEEPRRAQESGRIAAETPREYAGDGGRILSALQNVADGSIILLFSDQYTIGRAGSCDIVLPVMTVSRQHARLLHGERGWVMEDLGSRSGTVLNNRRLSANQRLYDGDLIAIGGAEYKFIESYMRE